MEDRISQWMSVDEMVVVRVGSRSVGNSKVGRKGTDSEGGHGWSVCASKFNWQIGRRGFTLIHWFLAWSCRGALKCLGVGPSTSISGKLPMELEELLTVQVLLAVRFLQTDSLFATDPVASSSGPSVSL